MIDAANLRIEEHAQRWRSRSARTARTDRSARGRGGRSAATPGRPSWELEARTLLSVTATLIDSPNVTTSGATYQGISVLYDGGGFQITPGTIDDADITVTDGANSYGVTALSTFYPTANSIQVYYEMTPPGGTWDGPDNGTYTISVNANEVANNNAEFAPSRPIGTFDVLIAPSVSISTTAGAQTNSSIPVTGSFSEEVTGFDDTDVIVGNGTVANFTSDGTVFSSTSYRRPRGRSTSPSRPARRSTAPATSTPRRTRSASPTTSRARPRPSTRW